jgi:hypothetical protein
MENELPTGVNSVYKKIHNIMTSIGIIEKDKTNDFHKYKYASEFAIKKAVHEALVNEKLILQLSEKSHTKEANITTVTFEYCFIDIETGDKMCGLFSGSGEDKGDKGLYKAFTGCLKYLLTTTFLIPTGDDPENDKKEEDKKEQPKSQSKAEPKTPTGKMVLTKEIASNYESAILNGEVGMYEEVFEKFVVGAAGKKMMDEAKKKYQELSGELTQ